MNIKKLPTWVRWGCEKDNPKRPYQADGITPASTTDSSTWSTWEEVKKAKKVGLVITKGIVFVDLDHVLVDNALVTWARDLLDDLKPSYIEISPSGDGLHLLFKGQWSRQLRNKRKIKANQAIEVYGKDRYSTITGVPFENSPLKINKLRGNTLQKLMGQSGATKNADIKAVKSGKTVDEIKEIMKRNNKWPKLSDAIGDEWKSEDDFKFIKNIIKCVVVPDIELISDVYLASNVVRKHVAERIEYHVRTIYAKHEFEFDEIPTIDEEKKPLRKRIEALKLTEQKAKEIAEIKMLVPNLIAKGHHAYIFGPAGSNKTTIIAALSVQMASEHGVYVDFWSFDATPAHNAAIERLSREAGVADLVSILAGGTIRDFHEHYDQAIEDKEDLSETVIVLDTYKFLVPDVNNKKESQKGMHYIKKLQGLGATFISLGHTNKDGKNHSGTAEVEQDSDGLFRIDRMVDDFTGEVTATISKAGRVRYETKDMTFSMNPHDDDFWFTSMKSVKLLDQAIDIKKKQEQAEQLKRDAPYVQPIKELIYQRVDEGYTQTEIVSKLKGLINRNTILKYLARWEGVLWKSHRSTKQNNAIIYLPIIDI